MDNTFQMTSYHLVLGDQLVGPYFMNQIIQMVQTGQLQTSTLVKSGANGQLYRIQDLLIPQNISPSAIPGSPQNFVNPTLVQPIPVPNYQNTNPIQPQTQTLPNNAYPNIGSNQPYQTPGYNMGMPMAQPLAAQQAPFVVPMAPSVQPLPPQNQPIPVQQLQYSAPSPQNNTAQTVQQPPLVPTAISSLFSKVKENILGEKKGDSVIHLNNFENEGQVQSQIVPHISPNVDAANSDILPPPKVSMRSWIDRTNQENGTIICPHCWGRCSMETVLFVAMHQELTGDALLGNDVQQRFLPKYYTTKGTAIDAKGMECTDMACPHCHLKIPSAVIDLPSTFFSIVGAPASGKSYFLTSMIWQLRKSLPKYFNFSIYDADPSINMVLNNYEKILFMNPDDKEYVSLPKTELRGSDFSNQINIDNNGMDLPRPFIFTMTPQETHPDFSSKGEKLNRSIVLYDNAGEHFEIGRDSGMNLATVHLVHSNGIIFLYDPLKDIRLKEKCSENDPQVSGHATYANQTIIFTEMVARIHKFANLKANEKYKHPLVVVVPKYDAWEDSFPLKIETIPFIIYDNDSTPYFDMGAIYNIYD